VPDGDYAALVRERRPNLVRSGRIVDTSGKVLAEHNGIEQFTIGQRKGLGFAAGERRFVLEIIPDENLVVVGPREECLSRELAAERVNWLIDPPEDEPLECAVKIRYRSQPASARVQSLPDQKARVLFAEPQLAITPGQTAVFYHGPRVLGGGWIQESGIRGQESVPFERLTPDI